MKRICSICARGGSKGVKNKNLRLIGGKPLLVHSLEQARDSGLFEIICLSSDSAEILACGRDFGLTHLIERPLEMASDAAPKMPVIRHCVQTVEHRTGQTFDIMVDLDATSPLRTVEDIHKAVNLLQDKATAHGPCNVITACEARRSPYFNMVESCDDMGRVKLAKQLPDKIVRRQDAPACFDMNASIYVWTRDCFYDETQGVLGRNTFLYEMPPSRSLDIDSPLDFDIVEFLMTKPHPQQ